MDTFPRKEPIREFLGPLHVYIYIYTHSNNFAQMIYQTLTRMILFLCNGQLLRLLTIKIQYMSTSCWQ